MFIDKTVELIKGYVEIEATGGFPERFINLCSHNKINIQDVKMCGNKISAVTDIKSYYKIRMVAKKSGMKVHIIKKHGLPFWMQRNRKRVGIVFGFVFLFVMTFFLSGRIWSVNVVGNKNIPEENIINAFEELGVKTGKKNENLNPKEISRNALKKMDDLMWNAVNVKGCKATIEVKERIEKNIEQEDNTPSNIVASDSGQIVLIENFLGTIVVDRGSAVEKGDIIVTGAVTNKDNTVSFYKADANVFAETRNIISAKMPLKNDMRVYTKVKKRYFVDFFGVVFPVNFVFNPKDDYDFSTGEDYLSSADVKLPVGLITQRHALYNLKKVKLTKQAAKLMAGEKYFKTFDEKLNEVKIQKIQSQITCESEVWEVRSVSECIESIGVSEKMDINIEND